MTRRLAAALAPETWLFLALGGFAVAALATDGSALSGHALVAVLAGAVAVAGLPHGALDPWVARRTGLWRGRWGWLAFNVAYVAVAAAVAALWWLAPGPGLVLFLALSAWHFGGDWRKDLPGWARAAVGFALLALPAWRWPTQVGDAFTLLAGPDGARLAVGLGAAAPLLAVAMVAAAALAWRQARASTLELAAVTTFALVLPPLVYFIVYFCALHSLRHLRVAARDADARSRWSMAGVALLYTALTVLAAAVAWPWLVSGASTTASADSLLRLVFIGLAALTLPHMLVVMWSEHTQAAQP